MTNGSTGSIGLKVAISLNAVLLLALGYGFVTTRSAIDSRFSSVEATAQQARETQTETDKKITNLSSDFEQINKRVGITSDQLLQARQSAQLMKRQQDEAAKQLSKELAAKANSTDVETVRQEATSKLAEFQQDSNAKLVTVSGEVAGVKQDLVATREEFGRQLVDVKTVLSDGIAKNSTELADLRRKGERDYFEFDLRRNSKQPLQRIADLQLALLKTDPKNHKYSIAIQVDDNRLEKKDRTTNEPVQFLVGRDSLRYEIVVNAVDKDRIRGYISAPKDKVLSAEAPTLRKQ
jgi:chromosome segregation ATPase